MSHKSKYLSKTFLQWKSLSICVRSNKFCLVTHKPIHHLSLMLLSRSLCSVKPNPPERLSVVVMEDRSSPFLRVSWEPPHKADTRSGWITLIYEIRVKLEGGNEWEVQICCFCKWIVVIALHEFKPCVSHKITPRVLIGSGLVPLTSYIDRIVSFHQSVIVFHFRGHTIWIFSHHTNNH